MESLEKQIQAFLLDRLSEAFPSLSPAFYLIPFRGTALPGMGTDGQFFYYRKEELFDAFLKDRLSFLFLHTLMHCLFLHFLPEGREGERWDLACDIAACYCLDTWFSFGFPGKEKRSLCYQALSRAGASFSAESIYFFLKDPAVQKEVPQNLFLWDSHRFWYPSQEAASSGGTSSFGGTCTLSRLEEIQKVFHFIESKTLPSVVRNRPSFGLSSGSRLERILLRKKGSYDFRRYLKRFSDTMEEQKMDPDEFDYIPYCRGLALYGNMPLLEPLEYRESTKIQDLVIAIDTSGSCSRDIVKRFLSETFSILSDQAHFFERMNVHLIQCDSAIQSHTVIHSPEEWVKESREVEILGRGGTDFTPVFAYVEKLQGNGELSNLKGLFYFTDGDGIYPTRPTPYETAFVFTDFRFLNYPVPSFITKLCLDIDQAGNEVFTYEH